MSRIYNITPEIATELLKEATICTCKVGPGKFEGEPPLTFLAYHAMLHGDVDSITDHDFGHYVTVHDWFRRPFNFDADPDALVRATAYGYCEPCLKAACEDEESFGLELYEDDNGFVYLNRYATEVEYDAALGKAEDQEDGNA
jgi:hypothetical protein